MSVAGQDEDSLLGLHRHAGIGSQILPSRIRPVFGGIIYLTPPNKHL